MKPLGLHACFVLSAALCGLAFFLLILLSHKAWAGYAPEVQRGLAWLESRVQGDGSLSGEAGSVASPFQARSAAQETLHALAAAPAGLVAAIAAEPDDNTEYLARRISTLSRAGQDTVPQVAALTARQNPDGGFGGAEGLASNALDTAWALLALKAAGGGTTAVPGALAYLQGLQAEDGAYGANGQSGIYVTAMALAALRTHASNYPLSTTTARAVSWLDSRRNADGNWEGSPWLTATAYLALYDFVSLEPLASQVRAFLTAAQAADGSWEGADPFVTALALRALVASRTAPADPALAELAGRVVDAQTHAPLTGVTATLTGDSFSGQVEAAEGVFQFRDLPAGRYTLSLSQADYGTLATEANLGSGQRLDLGTLPLARAPTTATGIIQGTIRDAFGGQPIEGVSVAVSGLALTALTSPAGNYQITGVTPGSVQVTASKAGYTTVTGSGEVVAGGQLLYSPVMAPGTENDTAIRGRVTRAGTGEALAGVQIVISGANTATATTDISGEYVIGGLTPGGVNLSASVAGYKTVSATGTLSSGTTLFFSPALSPTDTPDPDTSNVSGTVRDAVDDAPLEGVRVISGGETAYTDVEGRFLVAKSGGISFSKSGYIGGTLTFESAGAALLNQTDLGDIRLLREGYEGALLPDLLVLGIDTAGLSVDPQTLSTEGPVGIHVGNFGNTASATEAQVILYEDTDGDGRVGDADRLLGSGILPAGIEPGGRAVRIEIAVAPFTRAFRNSRLLAVVDGGQTVTEVREDNNLAPTSCLKPFPFVDDFDDGVYDGWTAIEANGSDIRAIENGILVVYPKNSLSAHWTGDLNWTDYTAEVRLRFPNGASNDAGIQYRQLGTAIHSGDSFRIKAHHARLIHAGNSVAEAPFNVEANRWYQLRVEITGEHVRAYIDNQRIFDYTGPLNAHGAVGLQEDGGVKVEYDDLRVFGPATLGPADISASRLRLIDRGMAGVELKILVGNGGGQPVPAGTPLAFFGGAPENGGGLLGTVPLPESLVPGASLELGLTLATGITGIAEVVAIADHDGSLPGNLPECDKTNNRIALAVTAENLTPSFITTLATDRGAYPAHTPVLVTAHVLNTGSLAGVVKARFAIETADGVLVANLDPAGPVTVSAGALAPLGVSWGTGSHYTGRYAVKATFLDAADRDIGQERVLFDIEASCSGAACAADQIGATVRTDKGIYQPYDVVRISGRVSNPAQNQVLEGLSAVTRVIGPDGALIWSRATPIPQLVAGGARALAHDVPLIRAEPGSYRVTLEALDTQGQTLTQANQPFSVQSSAISGAGLAGHLHADPVQVAVGDPVVISASVVNNGNADIASLPVTLSVLDPESETVLAQWTEPTNITQGQARTWLRDWTAQGTVDRVYVAALSAELAGTNITLAQTNIRLVDSPVRIELDAKFDPATRLLSLIACPPGAPDPVACASERKQWLDAYLAEGSLPHRGTTTTAEFSRELRCGRYNVHWASGSSHMLDWRGTTELGAAERLGRGLLVDGVHEPRNTTLDALAGVSFVAPMAGSDHLVELQAPGFAPLTLTAPGMALAFDLIGSSAVAVFPEAGGVPAIIAHQHGTGHGALAAFDLPAALATGVWDAPFTDIVNMATPVAADVLAGGTWVPVSLDLTNQGQPIVIEVSALLSADLRLDGVPEGGTLDALGQPVWPLALGAGEHRALRMAVWMPGSSGALSIPFLVSTIQGGTTQPYATVSLDLQVAAMDLHGPQLLAAIQALAPDSPEEQAALDAASTALADALVRFADGRLINALESFLAADVHLSHISSVPVDPLRADMARLIAQAQAAVCNAPPQPCDVDGDVDVDVSDTSLISRARGQSASPGDPRDANGDGMISPADVKACIPKCTRSNCAT